MLKTVKALSEEKSFDYLVIESTGISEPLPVAQTFVMDVDATDEGSQKLQVAKTDPASLSHYAELDTMVTVVDALNIFDTWYVQHPVALLLKAELWCQLKLF